MRANIPRGPRPRRRWLLVLGVIVVAVATAFTALTGFYIDVLWFREVGLTSVFWTTFWSRIGPALIFGTFFFLLLYANLLIVRAIRPRYRVFTPEEEFVERYRQAFEPYIRWIIPGVALLFAIFAATGIAVRWEEFQLWRVSGDVSFGVTDPVFGRDVSFYVLSLPFQRFVQGWLFSSLVAITIVTAAAHYLWGGIRTRATAERVTPQVKAHLSVLIGLAVLVKAWGYRLGQFDLLTSERGTVTGASYTDVNAQLPALKLLVIIAIVVTVLFLVNIRFRGWALPALGIGLLALTSVLAGAAYPAFIQRFRVAPQELDRERPFIERNLEFTRRAFGLDEVRKVPFAAEPDVTREEVESAQSTIDNIRLWNPEVLTQSYQQLQRIRPYYEFHDVDVDRYSIDGEKRVVMIAPREIAQSGITGRGRTWQNEHLFFTHGYGAAAARVDRITTEGAPVFALEGIPSRGSIPLDRPQIYFGEETDVPFVMVNTNTDEFDFPQSAAGETQFARTRYQGTGGIPVGGLLRRLSLAWRFRDVNLMISGLINSESRVLINRTFEERVRKIAPFLEYDYDPYVAIVDGRMVWVWDAYTTSNRYPYSQELDFAEATDGLLTGRGNYIRNSVKVVMDAYDGTMTFYTADPDDPIIEAWSKVFPDLLTPLTEAPLSLREHFRYPENLFQVQAHQYADYHVTDADQFYAKEDFWALPQVAQGTTTNAEGQQVQEQAAELQPYYVLVPLPGEDEESFVLFVPFTPADRPNMVSWMAAISDPDRYGELVSFEFPSGQDVAGPGQVASFIAQDPEVSPQVTLFDQRGSRVIFGDLQAIPIGQSFLYVQALYLQAQQSQQAIPELRRVIVVRGTAVTMAENLAAAIEQSLGVELPEEPGEPGEPTEPGTSVEDLLAQARDHFRRAEEALQAGDLARYEEEVELARSAVEEALALAAEQANGSPSPSPSPTP